jgi:hypothetical protein
LEGSYRMAEPWSRVDMAWGKEGIDDGIGRRVSGRIDSRRLCLGGAGGWDRDQLASDLDVRLVWRTRDCSGSRIGVEAQSAHNW